MHDFSLATPLMPLPVKELCANTFFCFYILITHTKRVRASERAIVAARVKAEFTHRVAVSFVWRWRCCFE